MEIFTHRKLLLKHIWMNKTVKMISKQNIATLPINNACTKMIDASVLLYFSFDSLLS